MRFIFLILNICILIFANENRLLPTGFSVNQDTIKEKQIYPLNPHLTDYPDYISGQAVRIKISPDKSKIAILTSGYNLLYNKKGHLDRKNSTEYIFIYSITEKKPKFLQVVKLPNSFYGFVWNIKNNGFFASGGQDDVVYKYEYIKNKYRLMNEIKLMHKHGMVKSVRPMVAEMALAKDGGYLTVVNLENDSVSLISTKKNKVVSEIDLKPHSMKISGGTFPFGIVITKDNDIYVSSMRDNELVKLHINNNKLEILKHIKIGSQPTELAYNPRYNELYVCESRSDTIRVIDTKNDKTISVFHSIPTSQYKFGEKNLKGAKPNGISIASDGTKLYVTNGGANSVSIFTIKHEKQKLIVLFDGLIPTLWYPNDVLSYHDKLYIVNGKSLSGPNKDACRKSAEQNKEINRVCKASNEYVWQTKNASLEVIKIPNKEELKNTTIATMKNDHMLSNDLTKKEIKTIEFLQKHIKHIIYVVKENRTYDQVLGDLKSANGDSNLTLFHEDIAPNHYALARNFVALDNLMASGSCSGDGWAWSTAAHTTEYEEKLMPMLYARRGF
ncbi:MAG TPA: hypothetical protein ENK66_08750, partial [Arcobacter sp.]|nr:hypothetical protein [Arcobacter sp.]